MTTNGAAIPSNLDAALPAACDDGIQNGDETGVDCGGSVCFPCEPRVPFILNAHSPACLTCAQSKPTCLMLLNNKSCDNLGANAVSGPAVGQPRSTLCVDLLKKMMATNCGAGPEGVFACYCGSQGDTCFVLGGNGVAKAEEERALESTDPGTINGNFGVTDLGGGSANQLVQCLHDNGCSACF